MTVCNNEMHVLVLRLKTETSLSHTKGIFDHRCIQYDIFYNLLYFMSCLFHDVLNVVNDHFSFLHQCFITSNSQRIWYLTSCMCYGCGRIWFCLFWVLGIFFYSRVGPRCFVDLCVFCCLFIFRCCA